MADWLAAETSTLPRKCEIGSRSFRVAAAEPVCADLCPIRKFFLRLLPFRLFPDLDFTLRTVEFSTVLFAARSGHVLQFLFVYFDTETGGHGRTCLAASHQDRTEDILLAKTHKAGHLAAGLRVFQ